MSVALEGASFHYPGGAAGAIDVSLAIGEGELMAVIGPSGCGKSTILKLIAGFLSPQSGLIRIDGKDAVDIPPRLRNLGIVFQNYALFPHMNVAENVGYPLKLRGVALAEAGARVADALRMVGLQHLAERAPRALSGGQQQRVALARALVFRPTALLLDEPLSALDAALRLEMRDEIARLQKLHGIATLHITHDQEEALSMADRIAVMCEGRIMQVGAPRAIYETPASAMVAGFVGHANLIPGEALDGTHVRLPDGDMRCQPHDFAVGTRILALLRPEGLCLGPSADGINIFPGVVTRDRYLGALRRFDFRTTAGTTLTVETDEGGAMPFAVHAAPAAIRILAAENETGGTNP